MGSAAIGARQIEIRTPRVSVASMARLRTPPGKRRVLSVVLSGDVIPRQAERVHVALRRVGQGKTIRRRMSGVVEMKGLCRVRIDPSGSRGRHVDQTRCLHGPCHAVIIEPDRRGFDAQKLADETR